MGTYIEGKSKNVVFPDDVRFPQIRIYKTEKNKAKNNDKVWVELDSSSLGTDMVLGKIIEVLGQANTPKAEQISIIRSHNIVDTFAESVLNEAKLIPESVSMKEKKSRTDFTKQRVITIDGEDARDFDDAISVESKTDGGYNLFVHIADVSNYVKENSQLDKEAYKRGTSIYFPNMVIPMLPKELSNGICSLSEGVERLTLSVKIELDKSCDIISSSIVEGVIKSAHRMTYTEIKNILAGDKLLIEKYADVYEDILNYQKISQKLKEKRKIRGEIRMDLPEPLILENKLGEIVSIQNVFQDEAHEIIESLMLLTNEVVAKTFFDFKLPFVYRVHEKPDEEKAKNLSQLLKNMKISNQIAVYPDNPAMYQKAIESLKGNKKEKPLTKLILRSMMKARYSPVCLGHFGLSSPFYCHFTSPIRRYPDLLIHRIIKAYLNKLPKAELTAKFKPIVERASEQSSVTEKNADEVEREVDDYKKAVYMGKFLGEEFVGTVSGVQPFGIFVELENGVEGMVKVDNLPFDEYIYDELNLTLYGKNHKFTIGDEVNVIVASANPSLRQINFELVGVENKFKVLVHSQKKSKMDTNNTKNKKMFKKDTKNKNKKRIKAHIKSSSKKKRRR